ncbi:DUF397 domain-containing protein [Kitasatospora sp. GP82]|uniref:DUF397 domain-containing protein n=1 Tax=Kitasatospora sp. GP82 TaxID=3035089 RepID=UPI0024765C9B|nr:DUF397 domain-containing protein [Kitasatospora sp. GP82]MDH6128746.1 hypothetical protein [Kitasatospora sp. GP82]
MSTSLKWFKSSYSNDQGGDCVEVAVSWRKSSYSDSEGGACVEVAACADTVHVRDSKDRSGPQLAFTPAAWAEFVAYAAAQPVA